MAYEIRNTNSEKWKLDGQTNANNWRFGIKNENENEYEYENKRRELERGS